jgi:chemosensory pili system protein ChpA (sensor histidine kinase/response regulator)
LATGDPIARGNIILGADTTPLEAGLSAAKEQAKAAGQEIQNAANGGDDSAAYQTRLQEMAAATETERRSRVALAEAADRQSRIERDRLAETAKAASRAAEAVATTGTAADVSRGKFEQFSASMKSMTGGFRAAVSSITGLMAAFAGIASVIGIVVTAVVSFTSALLEKSRVAKQAAKDVARLREESAKLAEVRMQPDTRDPVSDALKKEYAERLKAEQAILMEREVAARKLPKGKTRGDAIREIEAERLARREALAAELDERLKANQRNWELTTQARKVAEEQAAKEAAEAELKARQEADAELNQQRQDDIDEIVNSWKQATAKIGEAMADNQRQLLRQQDEQFARLRSDINGLFTTANTEVGINRVADLLETLIRKTEGNR